MCQQAKGRQCIQQILQRQQLEELTLPLAIPKPMHSDPRPCRSQNRPQTREFDTKKTKAVEKEPAAEPEAFHAAIVSEAAELVLDGKESTRGTSTVAAESALQSEIDKTSDGLLQDRLGWQHTCLQQRTLLRQLESGMQLESKVMRGSRLQGEEATRQQIKTQVDHLRGSLLFLRAQREGSGKDRMVDLEERAERLVTQLIETVEEASQVRHDRGERVLDRIQETTTTYRNAIREEERACQDLTRLLAEKTWPDRQGWKSEPDMEAKVTQAQNRRLEQFRELQDQLEAERETRRCRFEEMRASVSTEAHILRKLVVDESSTREGGEEIRMAMVAGLMARLGQDIEAEGRERRETDEFVVRIMENLAQKQSEAEATGDERRGAAEQTELRFDEPQFVPERRASPLSAPGRVGQKQAGDADATGATSAVERSTVPRLTQHLPLRPTNVNTATTPLKGQTKAQHKAGRKKKPPPAAVGPLAVAHVR